MEKRYEAIFQNIILFLKGVDHMKGMDLQSVHSEKIE